MLAFFPFAWSMALGLDSSSPTALVAQRSSFAKVTGIRVTTNYWFSRRNMWIPPLFWAVRVQTANIPHYAKG